MRTTSIAARLLMALGGASVVACGSPSSATSDAGHEAASTDGSGTSDAADGSPGDGSFPDAPVEATVDSGADADAAPDAPPCVRRPFLVEGELRACGLRRRSDWLLPLSAEVARIHPTTAAALARAWLEDARQEHASVAAFARFTMHLIALGAPPDLVTLSQRASIDEVHHARACFALARRYGGAAIGPGALSLDGALGSISLEAFAALTVHEGCVGETLGALLADEQSEQSRDTEVRRLLIRIARDELRHAELAWRCVRWAIDEGGAPVAGAVARAFAEAEVTSRAQSFADPLGVDAETWRAHGRLSAADALRLVAEGWRGIVGPCARALAGRSPPLAAAARLRKPNGTAFEERRTTHGADLALLSFGYCAQHPT